MAERPFPAEDTQDLDAFTGGKLFERLFAEGMTLVEETATYLDTQGREQARALPREAGLTYAAWSMELTTRLMQAASWLVMQKAVRDGDMPLEDAQSPRYRLTGDGSALDASAQRGKGLPDIFLDLVERSEALFERLCRLDHAIYVAPETAAQSPVTEQLEALRQAAATGAFDPLAVWQRGGR
ncbi:MAG: DUF1465 family protein [Pseudomonadota bacterium]